MTHTATDSAPTHVFLIRHGATANNVAHPPLLQGCASDLELSDEGRREARLTAEWLSAFALSAVYASPLLRAVQTAEAIAAPRGLPVIHLPEVRECDVGCWEGKSWAEIQATSPDAYARFIADSAAHPYEGGESLEDVRARVVPAIERLYALHAGRAFALVAHNVVNRVYLAALLGWPIKQARSIPQANCGVNLIEWRAGQGTVVTINGAFHLRELGSYRRAS